MKADIFKQEEEEIQVHKGCGAEAVNMGEDAISYCTECERIVEGDTEMVTLEEFEKGER